MRETTRPGRNDVPADRLGEVVVGVPHTIGDGFAARHFSEEMFGGRMDPLLMVDHFVMTAPTFEPHLHAGVSAVTAMFEDSRGAFLNRDTLGHDIALKGGDLYWLAAAGGAVHEERPEAGARVHALQIFVNLPARLKAEPARALHVRAEDVPVLESAGHRVRLVLGASGGVAGADDTPEPMTLLDGLLAASGRFVHALPEDRRAWLYVASGRLDVRCADHARALEAGAATTVAAGAAIELRLEAIEPTHFVMLAAAPIGEPFVKHGPLAMSTAADVRQTLARHAEGGFGRLTA